MTPILSILGCLLIIKDRGVVAGCHHLCVCDLGPVAFIFYFFYGSKHSRLGRHERVGLASGEETPL